MNLIFHDLLNTLLIRNKPPAIDKRSRDEPAPHFRTLEPRPPTRDGISEPKQLTLTNPKMNHYFI
ncbi:unnamed protein product, partial [Vitis vinifera]|uniref:Uncharacterized protein n=1 Tax=Vitis vinifera TaxID=29760 RepID=D7T7M3_VITVI